MYKYEKEQKQALARIKASKIHKKALALLSNDWKCLKHLRKDVEAFYQDAFHIMQDLCFAGLADMKTAPSTISGGRGMGSIFFYKLGTGETTNCPCLGMLVHYPGYGGLYVKGNDPRRSQIA